MSSTQKYRADQIGSMLRPVAVLDGRAAFESGKIDAAELEAIEDKAITEVVKLQEDVGISVITDGEFRRQDFRTGFSAAFEGFAEEPMEMLWHGPDGDVTLNVKRLFVEGPLKQRKRLTEGEAPFLEKITSKPIKSTLIAPGFIQDRCWKDGATDSAFAGREEFAEQMAAITRKEVETLIAEGVKYIQVDNPGYAAYVDVPTRERIEAAGEHPDASFQRMLDTDLAALKDIDRPDDVTIGLHVCRGNQKSLWLAEGSYEQIAEPLFNTLPVDRFLVEYSDERAGGFEPLRFVPKGTVIVLGLASTKHPELETVDELRARIDDAARFIDMDDLALSPQCGFASIARGGNDLSVEDERAKLALIVETARATWGDAG